MPFKLNKDNFDFGEGTNSSPNKILQVLGPIAGEYIREKSPIGLGPLMDPLKTMHFTKAQMEKYAKKYFEKKYPNKNIEIKFGAQIPTFKPEIKITNKSKPETSRSTQTKNKVKSTSYDEAYKNRDMKTYGKMSKAEYIKEAKRQKAIYDKTGKLDVKK
jgi:hypothetical protein